MADAFQLRQQEMHARQQQMWAQQYAQQWYAQQQWSLVRIFFPEDLQLIGKVRYAWLKGSWMGTIAKVEVGILAVQVVIFPNLNVFAPFLRMKSRQVSCRNI